MNADNLNKLVNAMVEITGAERRDILSCAPRRIKGALLRRVVVSDKVSLPFVFENGFAIGRKDGDNVVPLTESDIAECRVSRVRYIMPENLV